CPAVPSGSLSRLHLPSFSMNLVSTTALQDAMVTTTTPGGQRVSICTCTRTGRHLATFTRRPGSSLYTLATEPPQVAASAQVSALGPVAPPCSCRLLSHQTLLWHHRLGHLSLPRLRGMHSRLLVYGLPSKGQVVDVLIPWICAVRLQLRERFCADLPVLRMDSDRNGEFSSNLLRDICRGEGILQPFTLSDSPQQNGIAERRIGLVLEVARTSMIHAAAPHFLWPFAGPAPSSVSQVDPLPGTALVEVAVGSSAARGAASGVAEPGIVDSEGAGSGGAEPGGEEPGGAEPKGVEPGGAESEGGESGGAEPQGAASSGGPAGASSSLSPRQLRKWFVRHARLRSGATEHGGAGAAGAGGTGGTAATDPMEPGAGGARGPGAGGAGAGGAGVGGTSMEGAGGGGIDTGGAGVRGTNAGGARAGGAGAVYPGGTVRPRSYFVPVLQHVPGVPSSTSHNPPLLCPPAVQLQLSLQPASPLPSPSPYPEQSVGLAERLESVSHPVSPVCTTRCVPRSLPPPLPGTDDMALRPSFSNRARAANPTVSYLLTTAVSYPSFESAAASSLVAELLDFAAACRLDYATALVVESASANPPSVGGECALGTEVFEDRQEDFECLAPAVPRFASMLLAPEGDPDAPDIPTLCSYAEAITGFSQRQGVDYFQTFSPTPKMTTLRMLLHVAAQRDYELHSLDFSTAFLQGSLHEEIWLRRRPAPREWHDTLRTTLAALGFAPSTADPSLLLRTDTSLLPFYVLVYVNDLIFATADSEALTLVKSELQKRHTCTDLGELRSYLGLQISHDRAQRTITLTQSHMVLQVLQRFGFHLSSPQPTPLSTGHSLSAPTSEESVQPSGSYPELVGCLMNLMTCTRPDLAYPLSLLAFPRGSRSSCGAEIYEGAMAAQELRGLTYLLTDLGEQHCLPRVLYVDDKAMIPLCQEHRLEHRTKHIALRYFLAQELQQRGQLRLAYMASRANTGDIFTKALKPAHRDYELHSLEFSTAFLQFKLHEGTWLCHLPGFTGSFPEGTHWSLWRPVYDLREAPCEFHNTLRTTLVALGFAPSAADPSLFLRTEPFLPPFYILLYINDLVFATANTKALDLVKAELQKRHICTDPGEVRSYLGLQLSGTEQGAPSL
ncbi:unnamed protein product, partial [Closterium sp. NIES-54]